MMVGQRKISLGTTSFWQTRYGTLQEIRVTERRSGGEKGERGAIRQDCWARRAVLLSIPRLRAVRAAGTPLPPRPEGRDKAPSTSQLKPSPPSGPLLAAHTGPPAAFPQAWRNRRPAAQLPHPALPPHPNPGPPQASPSASSRSRALRPRSLPPHVKRHRSTLRASRRPARGPLPAPGADIGPAARGAPPPPPAAAPSRRSRSPRSAPLTPPRRAPCRADRRAAWPKAPLKASSLRAPPDAQTRKDGRRGRAAPLRRSRMVRRTAHPERRASGGAAGSPGRGPAGGRPRSGYRAASEAEVAAGWGERRGGALWYRVTSRRDAAVCVSAALRHDEGPCGRVLLFVDGRRGGTALTSASSSCCKRERSAKFIYIRPSLHTSDLWSGLELAIRQPWMSPSLRKQSGTIQNVQVCVWFLF